MGCIIYSPHWLQTTLSHIAKMGELYTYIIGGAFSVARFDRQAMREPRYVERAAELASRSFIQKCMLHRGYQ